MNRKIIDILFILLIISAPFRYANKIFKVPGVIAGPFAYDFVIWPLILGILYTLYCQWKFGNILCEWKRVKRFIISYFIILLLSIVWGLFIFPYYDLIFNAPKSQLGKMVFVVSGFSKVGIHLEEKSVLVFLIFIRSVKSSITSLLYTFCGAYMIFCWYHNNLNRAIKLLKNVTTIFLAVLIIYGLIEMCYQNGQMWAQNFLGFMWNIIHSNPEGMHYPVLMNARIRTMFLEASYFSIFLTFAFPILWWKMCETKGRFYYIFYVMYILLGIEAFLTQARTATIFFVLDILLFAFGSLYLKNRRMLINTFFLLIGSLISFCGATYFLGHFQVPAQLGDRSPLANRKMELIQLGQWPKGSTKDSITEKYINDSVLSVVNFDKHNRRLSSNYVRYGVTLANVKIGLSSPILGVGYGLDTAYLYQTFKKDKNGELKNRFIKQLEEKGVLNVGSPFMCEYTAQFMQTGIVGLIFFIFPMLHIIYLLVKIFLKNIKYEEARDAFFILMLDLGLSLTGCTNTLNITWCYWLMLGLSYAYYFNLNKLPMKNVASN